MNAKLKVLHDKNKQTISDGLYINDALMPYNRQLMGRAKVKSFAVFLSGSRIFIKKDKRHVKIIECKTDIIQVEKCTANTSQILSGR